MTRESTDQLKVRNRATAWTIGFSVLALAGYFATYRCLARERIVPMGVISIGRFQSRLYDSPILAKFFVPAAWLEAKLTHSTVQLVGFDRREDNFRDNRTFNYTIDP